MSTSLCRKIYKIPPKCIRNERRGNFYSRCSIVAAASAMSGDAVFHCESKTTLFGLPKEDTTRNKWLSCVYNTVPEQFNPNIRVCAAHFTEDYFLNLPAMHKVCFYKVGQFQLCKNSLALLTQVQSHWKYVFLFKEFATDDSNVSFEQCRVVLVVCRFSDHKCRHGKVYTAQCNARQYNAMQDSISHYNQ